LKPKNLSPSNSRETHHSDLRTFLLSFPPRWPKSMQHNTHNDRGLLRLSPAADTSATEISYDLPAKALTTFQRIFSVRDNITYVEIISGRQQQQQQKQRE